jgi:hypothetical protein
MHSNANVKSEKRELTKYDGERKLIKRQICRMKKVNIY